MRKALASLVALLALPSLAAAGGEIEIGGFAGYTFPFYSQKLTYDPGPVTVDIPGVTITQSSSFELKASGGPVFGGSIGLFPVDALGFELRFDRSDLTVKTKNPTYHVHATMPSPLAPVDRNLELTKGEADLNAANTFSLNLKVRSSGDTRVYLSGGLSHVSDLGFSMQQTVALGVSKVDLVQNNLEIATISLRAKRKPGDPKSSNWGGNAGLGFRIPLGEHGGLVIEGRGFLFPKQTFEWEGVIDTPLGNVEKDYLERLLGQLDPVEFKPWWLQATIGVCYRF
jgi:hypothetical protein